MLSTRLATEDASFWTPRNGFAAATTGNPLASRRATTSSQLDDSANALGAFYRAYPDVQVDLGVGNRVADLVAEGVDCAIRAGQVTEQALVARRIGEFHFTTCATPQLLSAIGTPAAPDDLRALPTVGMV